MPNCAQVHNGTESPDLTIKPVNQNLHFRPTGQKKWDIMLSIVRGESRRDISRRYDVSLGYVAQVAVEYGISRRSKPSSFIRDDGDKAFLVIGVVSSEIDPEHALEISKVPWHILREGYISSAKHGLIHRWLVGAHAGDEVDHIDGNNLNNRTSNLRIVTRTESLRNRRRMDTCPTIFKGVRKRRGQWEAAITVDGSAIKLGLFRDPINAAVAYDSAARREFREHARLNFPEVNEQSALLDRDYDALSRIILKAAS